MDAETKALLKRLTEALEGINAELKSMNTEGVVVFAGSDHLEN